MITYDATVLPILTAGLFFLLGTSQSLWIPVYLKTKDRGLRSTLPGVDGQPMIEDPDRLARAQEAVNKLDWRLQMSNRGFVIAEELHVINGFGRDYMKWLIKCLSDAGFETYFETIDYIPTGVASYNEAAGTQLLYCHRDDRQKVLEFLDVHFKENAQRPV